MRIYFIHILAVTTLLAATCHGSGSTNATVSSFDPGEINRLKTNEVTDLDDEERVLTAETEADIDALAQKIIENNWTENIKKSAKLFHKNGISAAELKAYYEKVERVQPNTYRGRVVDAMRKLQAPRGGR